MNNNLYLQEIILDKIKEAKIQRGYKTNKKLCEAFNRHFRTDIDNGLVKSLNKDFLFRMFSGQVKFLLSSHRFAKICEFLKISIDETHTPLKISKAAYMVDELIKQKPELEKQIYSVVQSITNLSQGIKV